MDKVIGRDDYAEPRCLLDLTPPGKGRQARIPIQRVVEKFDEYSDRRDWAGAERHLLYWMAEAESLGDDRGRFSLLNEMMGFYRKQGAYEKAEASVAAALALLDVPGADSTAAGTCLINAATVHDTFDEPERALPLFDRAREIYERTLAGDDPRLGGLYNNMGLSCAALGQFERARDLYDRALTVMAGKPLEESVTWLNLADVLAAEQGEEAAEAEISACLTRAEACLNDPALPRDGYYAFVCEKAAPGFDHYGWFACAAELRARSEEIYQALAER